MAVSFVKIKKIFVLIVLGIFFFSQDAEARLNIVATIPDLASIAEEVGGDLVNVESLARGYQDTHWVDARPSFVVKLNRADMMIKNGIELEIGWLPVLVTGARNSKIASQAAEGYVDASTFIDRKLEVPDRPVDRSMGDVHPGGNPHYTLDPRNAFLIARGIADRLSLIDPDNSSVYDSNFERFSERLEEKIAEWEDRLSEIEGTRVITYHKRWSYFFDWSGLIEAGTIESKPGIPPTPSHVAQLIRTAEREDVRIVLASNWYPQRTARIIADKLDARHLQVPGMVGGVEGTENYFDFFDYLIDRIVSAVKQQNEIK